MFVRIKNKDFKVKVCNSIKEIQNGMMGKKFVGFDGMLFLMGLDDHSFWMKNCIIPLDIIYINEDLTISKIHHDCHPCEKEPCKHYTGKGEYVLEVPGGTCKELNIDTGDDCIMIFENH